MNIERFETVVIGAGQSGLAAGYHLAKAGRQFVILEANPRVGDSWRNRWDSLRLFTPAKISTLPGLRFPAPDWTYPTKDEVAAYVEGYAATFQLPVRTSVRVSRLGRDADRFVIETGDTTYEADNVVVATGADRVGRVPAFASELDPSIQQLHSSAYRNPAMLRPGGVLIVGAANSGAEIALDVASMHRTWLAGTYRQSPRGWNSRLAVTLLSPFIVHVMTIDTPIGRRVRREFIKHAAPVIRVTQKALAAAQVTLAPRMSGVQDGRPVLADGTMPEVANVIWCTGFAPGLEWIALPIHDERGEAREARGVSTDVPGLYFVGRPFQYSWTSSVIHGVDRDSKYVVEHIVRSDALRDRRVMTRPVQA